MTKDDWHGNHLGAVQGSSEACSEMYIGVLRTNTGAADTVMYQKQARDNKFTLLIGACDG